MWHPFDLYSDLLRIAPELRTARPGANAVLSYEERALTYFKDKSSTTEQWPVTMDQLPGLRIIRRTGGPVRKLEITHTWELDYYRTLSGTLYCSGAWQVPRSWSFVRTFKPRFAGAAEFAPVAVEGSFMDGELKQTHSGAVHRQVQTEPAGDLLSAYALMAGFPPDTEPLPPGAAFLGEDLMLTHDARVLRCPAPLRNHPLAKGLQGILIDTAGNFPTEFWINKHGLVLYVFNGVSKAFILREVEEAA